MRKARRTWLCPPGLARERNEQWSDLTAPTFYPTLPESCQCLQCRALDTLQTAVLAIAMLLTVAWLAQPR